MKRIVDGKEYIQLDDLLLINKNKLDIIPKSLWDKMFENDITLLKDDDEIYIELTSLKEKVFIDFQDYIYDRSQLDLLSIDFLYMELSYIKTELKINDMRLRNSQINGDKYLNVIRDNKTKLIIKYNSLIDYLKNRMNKECSTCEYDCEKKYEDKNVLDEDGKIVSHDCKKYINGLVK